MMKRAIIGIALLAIYAVVALPIINSVLLPTVVDFINSNPSAFKVRFASVRYVYNSTNNTFQAVPESTELDLRGLVIFLVQFTVYIVLPVAIALAFLKR